MRNTLKFDNHTIKLKNEGNGFISVSLHISGSELPNARTNMKYTVSDMEIFEWAFNFIR